VRAARNHAPASARAVALRLLARRDYSRQELERRLQARGLPRADIDVTLDDFERLGYLSDERYAHAIVAQRLGRFGKREIARDLHDKGIAADAAKDALAALADRDELADATAVWQRRFGRAPTDEREKARQVRFLVARGYSASIAFRILRNAGSSVDDETS
jgi:regulatory protein